MLNNKYRVHEVAKDFGKNSKEITDILTEYATTPKNHMQPLDDRELSLIFEYLTQHNQVDSLESIFAEVYPIGFGFHHSVSFLEEDDIRYDVCPGAFESIVRQANCAKKVGSL